ncbi:MAG: flagellar hook-length control protein FliK, partial [Caulobacteraceae bacterium]
AAAASAGSAATAATAADDAGASDDAASTSSLTALLGAAQPTSSQSGAPVKTADAGTGGLNTPTTAVNLGAGTVDTASVVGGAGSTSDSGSQDSSEQGAAKTASDQAAASQTAAADGDLPDAVIEAAYGGMLAATAPLATAQDDSSSDPSTVTSDTISDLASQTAAQAPTAGGVKSFQIVLNPESLGQVKVSVNIGEDGQLNAAFAFDKPESAAALSSHAQDLREALSQSGFNVASTGLSFTTSGAQTAAAAPATAVSQTLTLNLGQDFGQGLSSVQGVGSLTTGLGLTQGASVIAAQTVSFPDLSGYARASARGLDVRV